MHKLLAILLVPTVLFITTGIEAAPERDAAIVLAREAPFDASADEIRIELDPLGFRALAERGAGTVRDFPLPGGESVDLELNAFRVVPPHARFINVDREGTHEVSPPDVRFLRGFVVGDADSSVVLGLFQNRVLGSIRTSDASFGVGPRKLSLDSAQATDLRVWNRATEKGGAVCDADTSGFVPSASFPGDTAVPVSPTGGAQLRIDLAMDSTTEWCAHFNNNSTAAQVYLLSVAAQISAIYDAEVLEVVEVPFLRTFCGAADPWTNNLTLLANRSQLLSQMAAHWSANMDGVARTVAHLYQVSEEPNGFAGGLAQTYVCSGQQCSAVLCNTDFGYGVNMLPADGGAPANFEIQVSAHELGHNHSSPHANCLQGSSSQWLSTCAVENCGGNPWCQATGCYPGPVNTAMTGTLMSTGCANRVSEFENSTEAAIIRGAAEAASCVESAGLPGAVTEETGGLRLAKVTSCPSDVLSNDDGTSNVNWSACNGCQYAWIKRFTPECYPFRITSVQAMVRNVSVGRPVRILVYHDPAGTGSPANATLVHTQDVTVQVLGPALNSWTLSTPETIAAGDVYVGLYDLVAQSPAPFLAPMDSSNAGDSFSAINTTSPGSFVFRPEGTWMIRATGGAVPAGTVALSWGPPCNDVPTPDQDFAVYRGTLGDFDDTSPLTCSTDHALSYVAQAPPAGSFFLVVPETTPSEGSYGQDSDGVERPPSAAACRPQDFETCPGG